MGPREPNLARAFLIWCCLAILTSISAERWSTPISNRRSDIIDDWVPLAAAETSASVPPQSRAIQNENSNDAAQGQIHLIPQQPSIAAPQQAVRQLAAVPQQAQGRQAQLAPQIHPQTHLQQQIHPQTIFQAQPVRQAFSFPNQPYNFQPQLVALPGPQYLMSSHLNGTKPEVQLVYVPVDTLRAQGRLPPTLEQQTVRQGKLQQQFLQLQNNLQQVQQQHLLRTTTYPQLRVDITTTTPAPKTTLKPHQPPLSVYMGGQEVKVSDVVKVLKNAKSIAVLDQIGPDSPQVFVGPSNIQPPQGYAKFELPYLNSLESNRIERKVEQLPFFVAPLSFQPPPGYSKIPFPAPHVGSVVVSNITLDRPPLHIKPSTQAPLSPPPPPPPTIAPIKTRQPAPRIPTITAELPGLVNSLQDSKNNILLVSSPPTSPTPTPTPTRYHPQEYEVQRSTPNIRHPPLESELPVIPESQTKPQTLQVTTPAQTEVSLQQPEEHVAQVNYQQQYIQQVSAQPPPPSQYSLEDQANYQEAFTEAHFDDDYTTATLPPSTTSKRPFRGRQRATLPPNQTPRRNSRTRRPPTRTYEEHDYQEQDVTPTTQTPTTNTYRSHVRSRPRTSSQSFQRTRQRGDSRKRITTSTEIYEENYPKLPEGENYPQPIQSPQTTTDRYIEQHQQQQEQQHIEINQPLQTPEIQRAVQSLPVSYDSIPHLKQETFINQPTPISNLPASPIVDDQFSPEKRFPNQPHSTHSTLPTNQQNINRGALPATFPENIFQPNTFIEENPSQVPPSTENAVIQEMQYFAPQRNKAREPEPEKIFQIEEETIPVEPSTTTTTTHRPFRRTRVRTRQRVNQVDNFPSNHRRTTSPLPTPPATTVATTTTTEEEESYGFFRTPNFKRPSSDSNGPPVETVQSYVQDTQASIPLEEEEIVTPPSTTPRQTSRRYNNNFVSRGSSRRQPHRSTTSTTTPTPDDKVYTLRPSRRQHAPQTRLANTRSRIRKPTSTSTPLTEEPPQTRRPQYNNEVDEEIPTRRISTNFKQNIDPTTERFKITLVDEQPYQQKEQVYQVPESVYQQVPLTQPPSSQEYTQVPIYQTQISDQQQETKFEDTQVYQSQDPVHQTHLKQSKIRVTQEYDTDPAEIYESPKSTNIPQEYQTRRKTPKTRISENFESDSAAYQTPEKEVKAIEYQPEEPLYQTPPAEYSYQKQTKASTNVQAQDYQFYPQEYNPGQEGSYPEYVDKYSGSPSSFSDGQFEEGGQESKLSTIKLPPPTPYQNTISTTEKERIVPTTESLVINDVEQTEKSTLSPENEESPNLSEDISKDLLTGFKKAVDPEDEKKSRPVRRRLVRVRVKNTQSDMLDTAESQNIGIVNRIPVGIFDKIPDTPSPKPAFTSAITETLNSNPSEEKEAIEEELDRVVTQRYLVKMINEELAEAVTDPWQKQLMDEVKKELISEPEPTHSFQNLTQHENEEITSSTSTTTTTTTPTPNTTSTTTTTSTTESPLTTININNKYNKDEEEEDEDSQNITTEKEEILLTTTEKEDETTTEILTTPSTTSQSPTTTTTTTTTTRPPKGPPMPDMPEILATSTTTEISHETEICFRGRCVKTKGKYNEDRDLEASD